jgi:DNA-binding CsgD family transcriptional regulator
LSDTLIGREPELAAIDASLEGLDDGLPGFLALEGEAGLGKTRLLGELRRRAGERGFVVLSGAAAEFERELPFAVWSDALDAYVISQDFASHDSWSEELAGELAQVLPSLRAGNGAGGAVAEERYRVHRATGRLLTLIAEEMPLVLILDDLHWSDEASLELIAALARRGPAAPVLIALGLRPGPAAARLAAELGGERARRLELRELTKQQAELLLDGFGPAAVEEIYLHGGGNPFYLEQLGRVADGTELGLAQARAGPNTDVPPVVVSAITKEVAALKPVSRSFLEAASVAGDPFELDLAAAIAGLEQVDAIGALDDLLDLDLARSTQVPRRFLFRHPLVRQAVYESTRAGWRLAAHERAADFLAGRGAAVSERAHHVERSARPGDAEAIEVLLRAGDASASRAPAAAATWFEAALRLLPDADAEQRLSVRLSLATALRTLGEFERCHETLLEAIDSCPPENAERRVELTALCASVEHWMGSHEAAHKRLMRAWEEVPDRSSPVAVAVQIELAIDGFFARNEEQTLTTGLGALETATALEDHLLIAAAASVLCVGEAAAGRIDSAREHHAVAVRHVDDLTDQALVPRQELLCHLGWAENYLELYDEALAHLDRGIRVARLSGIGSMVVPMMLAKNFPLEMQGGLGEAIEVAESAVEATRLAGNPQWLFWSLFELGWNHYYAGHLEEAIAVGEESLTVGGRLTGGTMPSAGGGPGWLLACARFEAGEVERARKEMAEMGSDWLEHKIPAERCFDWESMTLIELASGDTERADEYARRAEENAEKLGLKVPAAVAGRARAAVLLAGGKAVEAARLAGESGQRADSVGASLQGGFCRALQGRALAAAGDRDQAVAVLREAERIMDECGSVRVRDEMRRELRRLGARTEVRGPGAAGDSGADSLSRRELEIAELVTDRLTNPQIAQKLFLSKKTVETHIRNTFHKLGVSSRVEVARVIEQDRRERNGATESPVSGGA